MLTFLLCFYFANPAHGESWKHGSAVKAVRRVRSSDELYRNKTSPGQTRSQHLTSNSSIVSLADEGERKSAVLLNSTNMSNGMERMVHTSIPSLKGLYDRTAHKADGTVKVPVRYKPLIKELNEWAEKRSLSFINEIEFRTLFATGVLPEGRSKYEPGLVPMINKADASKTGSYYNLKIVGSSAPDGCVIFDVNNGTLDVFVNQALIPSQESKGTTHTLKHLFIQAVENDQIKREMLPSVGLKKEDALEGAKVWEKLKRSKMPTEILTPKSENLFVTGNTYEGSVPTPKSKPFVFIGCEKKGPRFLKPNDAGRHIDLTSEGGLKEAVDWIQTSKVAETLDLTPDGIRTKISARIQFNLGDRSGLFSEENVQKSMDNLWSLLTNFLDHDSREKAHLWLVVNHCADVWNRINSELTELARN